MQRYLKHLDKIILIQDYLEELAGKNNVKIIQNYNLDNTVNEALELIFKRIKDEFAKVSNEYVDTA
jgi:2-phosphoglycerate kinase